MNEYQWKFLIGWFIGLAIIYATYWLGKFLYKQWLYMGKWGSKLPNKVKFLSEMPRTFVETYVGCLLYDTDSGKFVTTSLRNHSHFLVEFAWRDNSDDILLIGDAVWRYTFHPNHSLQNLTKFVGDKIATCVFVPCKIYYSPKPKVRGIGEMSFIVGKRSCYVALDHLNAFRSTRFLCETEYGHRTKEELEELDAVIRIEHNQSKVFEGSVGELTARYGLPENCGETGIIEWCQMCGHAFQIYIGGTA